MERKLPGAGPKGQHASAAERPAQHRPVPVTGGVRRHRRVHKLTAVFTSVLVVGLAAQLHLLTSGGGLASASTVTPQPLVAGHMLSGVVGEGGLPAVNAFGAWRGRPVDVVTNYLATNSWSAITNVAGEGLTQYLAGSNVHRVWSVPMLPSDGEGNMASEAAGAYNSKFYTVAQALVAGGDGGSTIRLGWEMTGNWYAWSGQSNPSQFAEAWRQIVTSMRSVPGAHFTFDFNIAMFNVDPTPMYPGDGYVDMIGADNYDDSYAWQYPASDHPAVWNYILTGPYGLNWLSNFAGEHGKPMSFPEWGVSQRCDAYGGGDDTYFMQHFYDWMLSHNVAYETYSEFAESSCRNFVLTSGAFPNASALYRQLVQGAVGSVSPPTTTPPTTKPPTTTPPSTKPPTTTPPTSGAPPTSTTALSETLVRASAESNRSESWALQGSTIQGERYLFVTPPSNTTEVRFYLDRATSAGPTWTESWAPWDFMGGSDAAANAWNVESYYHGAHKLIVLATLSSGVVESATVSFNTD